MQRVSRMMCLKAGAMKYFAVSKQHPNSCNSLVGFIRASPFNIMDPFTLTRFNRQLYKVTEVAPGGPWSLEGTVPRREIGVRHLHSAGLVPQCSALHAGAGGSIIVSHMLIDGCSGCCNKALNILSLFLL